MFKAFNPDYVPVKYYNRSTRYYHLIKYHIAPYTIITVIVIVLLAISSILN